MSKSVYDEIRDRAKCIVADGDRDPDSVFREAFDYETDTYWAQWELLQEIFNPDEFFEQHLDEIFEHVKDEVFEDIEDMVEEAEEEEDEEW